MSIESVDIFSNESKKKYSSENYWVMFSPINYTILDVWYAVQKSY